LENFPRNLMPTPIFLFPSLQLLHFTLPCNFPSRHLSKGRYMTEVEKQSPDYSPQ
jgi:hypothetical protein